VRAQLKGQNLYAELIATWITSRGAGF